MKLLVDMNLSPHWVDQLHAAGLPAVHWSGIGRMDAPVVEIMAYAAKYDYVVVTHDSNYAERSRQINMDSVCISRTSEFVDGYHSA